MNFSWLLLGTVSFYRLNQKEKKLCAQPSNIPTCNYYMQLLKMQDKEWEANNPTDSGNERERQREKSMFHMHNRSNREQEINNRTD